MSGTRFETSVPVIDADADAEDAELDEIDLADPNGEDVEAVEARARRMGWVPLSEFPGNPAKWAPASEWVRNAEEMLGVARSANHRLERKLIQNERMLNAMRSEVDSLKRNSEEQLQIIREQREMGRRANEAGYQRALKEIESRKLVAVENSDKGAYEDLVEEEEALRQGHAEQMAVPRREEPPRTAAPAAERPQVLPETIEWVRQNPWFDTDLEMKAEMIGEDAKLAQRFPNMDLTERYARAKSVVVRRFPERFPGASTAGNEPQPQPRRRSTVSEPTPGGRQPRASDALTINSIEDPQERQEARLAFERQRRQMPDYTEQEYMELYTNPHADALAVAGDARRRANAPRK